MVVDGPCFVDVINKGAGLCRRIDSEMVELKIRVAI